jgi:hypothetical protein
MAGEMMDATAAASEAAAAGKRKRKMTRKMTKQQQGLELTLAVTRVWRTRASPD